MNQNCLGFASGGFDGGQFLVGYSTPSNTPLKCARVHKESKSRGTEASLCQAICWQRDSAGLYHMNEP
eukprot:5676331-Amphidinium_carterae.1